MNYDRPVASGVLYESAYHRCTLEPGGVFLRVVRTAQRFPDAPAATIEYTSLSRALEFAGVNRPRALFDLREAPLRSGDAIDEVATKFVAPQLAPFKRAAVLVRTAVGKLQILRLTKEHGHLAQVFEDEPAAVQYLTAPGAR